MKRRAGEAWSVSPDPFARMELPPERRSILIEASVFQHHPSRFLPS